MLTEAKSTVPWDLADKRTQKPRFNGASFYIVVDGFKSESVRSACSLLKRPLLSQPQVKVRGPKAMPTQRRRYMVMREVKLDPSSKGMYLKKPLRYRNVLLVITPTSACMNGLINLTLPSDVNVKIEPYENQYGLREDR